MLGCAAILCSRAERALGVRPVQGQNLDVSAGATAAFAFAFLRKHEMVHLSVVSDVVQSARVEVGDDERWLSALRRRRAAAAAAAATRSPLRRAIPGRRLALRSNGDAGKTATRAELYDALAACEERATARCILSEKPARENDGGGPQREARLVGVGARHVDAN